MSGAKPPSMEASSDPEVVRRLTAAMREADKAFESVGGSTRHFVHDCLLPALEAQRLSVVDVLVPQHLKSSERDVGSLSTKLNEAEHLSAAATDLLAAGEAVNRMAQFVFGNDPLLWPAQWREELTALRAAIAKARGVT